ncbi:hypothetical protein L0Y65_02520 [Candidatus Micrarchaeota archaeon]|nr:hypothetical protein [Candidatus Micrarchaeota archaeon]
MTFASTSFPQMLERDLRPLVVAAGNNNQQEFAAVARASMPREDPAAMFQRFRQFIQLGSDVRESWAGWQEAHVRRDQAGMRQFGEDLGRTAARGTAMGISGSPQLVMQEGKGQLTDQQREDFARAAVGYGFAVADVMSVFGNLGRAGGGRTEEQASAFRAALQTAAVERSQELMKRLRDLQRQLDETEDPAKKRELNQDRQQMLLEYGRLAGRALATEVADQWSSGREGGGNQVNLTAQRLEQSVRDETQHVLDLHTGRLYNVRISPVERMA